MVLISVPEDMQTIAESLQVYLKSSFFLGFFLNAVIVTNDSVHNNPNHSTSVQLLRGRSSALVFFKFPEQSSSWTDRQLWMTAGQRRLVNQEQDTFQFENFLRLLPEAKPG